MGSVFVRGKRCIAYDASLHGSVSGCSYRLVEPRTCQPPTDLPQIARQDTPANPALQSPCTLNYNRLTF